MATSMARCDSSSWRIEVNQLAIREVLRSCQFIERIGVGWDGRIDLRVVDWQEVWRGAADELVPEQLGLLQSLRACRESYITSGYDLALAPAYSWAYFVLLRSLLEQGQDSPAMRVLSGLECFTVTGPGDNPSLAAGTVTIRHPGYLLATLREPRAYDDVKFLPLIHPAGCVHDHRALLFYHYRQVKLQNDPAASLLMYPAVDPDRRTKSFACIEALASALSLKPDPRSRQRAIAITDWAVAPFLGHPAVQMEGGPELSFVDIGGGSGSLLSEVSKRLIQKHRAYLNGHKLAWSIVDVAPQDVIRRTHSRQLRQHMSYIDYQPADYRSWIAETASQEYRPRYDVAMICRLLNNDSRIGLESSRLPDEISKLTRPRGRSSVAAFHPADCLAGIVPDCKSLIASNARVRLRGGTTFRQASLSDYFRGLSLISTTGQAPSNNENSLFFTIRRFNPDSLLFSDEGSILEPLSKLTKLIVIEDIDLTPEFLIEHLRGLNLNDLAASDATDRIRMQSAHLLCVTRRNFQSALPGKQLW